MAKIQNSLVLTGPIVRPRGFALRVPLCHHHRTLFERFFRGRERKGVVDPNSAAYKKKVRDKEAEDRKQGQAALKSGHLARNSLFSQLDKPLEKALVASRQARGEADPAILKKTKAEDWREIKATALDPNPRARIKWQRKMVIRDVRGRGRLSRTEKILRTERSHVLKSPFIKTSVKKLSPLARQIAGKPINEAMIQMRFSKKKAASDMLKHLQHARNQAIVEKRMGLQLGRDNQPLDPATVTKDQENALTIRDRSGKRRTITDRSAIYVDQAWVGRGEYRFGTDFRARGRSHKLYLPQTSVSVVLKEEATRIREAAERRAKQDRKKVWVQLPDRPVTAQRQYPLW